MMAWRRRGNLLRSWLISICSAIWMLKTLYIQWILGRISRRIHYLCIRSRIRKIGSCLLGCHLLFQKILLKNSKGCFYLMIWLLIICYLIIHHLLWRGKAIFIILNNFVNMMMTGSWSNILVIWRCIRCWCWNIRNIIT